MPLGPQDKSVNLIIKSYGWAISLLAMLSIVSGIANYAALEEQAGHIEFSMAAHQQAQLHISIQSGIASIHNNAKKPLLDERKFERLQRQLAMSVADLQAVNLRIATILEGNRPFWRGDVPDEVRAIYLEKPYELSRWMKEAVDRGKVLANLSRKELKQNDANWTPLEVAMAAGATVKGFGAAAAAVERVSVRAAARMETVHIVFALLALVVIAAEAGLVFGPLVSRVRAEQRRAEAAVKEMEALAFRDTVTGGANRACFNNALLQACSAGSEAPFAVILCDLDKFKSINDGFGHQFGDLLLVEVARRIREAIRSTDLVARLGGDEFAVLAHGIGTPEALSLAVLRIREAVAATWDLEGISLDVSASVGGALCPMHSTEPDRLLAYADRALYAAKQAVQHTSVFDQEQQERSDGDSALLRALPGAIAHDEFELHYQPKVRLGDGYVAGVEALVRWRHPEHGILMPGTFLPVVNRGGRMVELTRSIVDMAGRDLARWRREGLGVPNVAINIPESMLTSRLGLECLGETIERYRLSGDMFTIEITEDVFVSRAASAIQASVASISELGVRVAFDDFGTGYASLSHLRQFSFDELKIDRSFVNDIGRSAMGEEIVHAIASLARALGKDIVVEGIETEEQLQFVRAEGCTYVQGYLFSRPLPADQLEDWVRRREAERQALAQVSQVRPLRA